MIDGSSNLSDGSPSVTGAPQRSFTRRQLLGLDGARGPAHVAYEGRVFDVSGSREWRHGLHRGLHWAGQDLTEFLVDAPHGVETLLRFPAVGILVDAEEGR